MSNKCGWVRNGGKCILEEENTKLKIQISAREEVVKELEDRINKATNDIDLVIELIKQQPTEDDSWILERLNSFKILLKGGNK